MVNNKKLKKMCKLSFLQVAFLSPKFAVVCFVGSIISSQVTTESLIKLPKYSSFSQEHVVGFQI